MPYSIIHQATAQTSWRILSLLRLGERPILVLKRVLGMTESAFSHALRRLEQKKLVATRKVGREKIAWLTNTGRIVFSSLQALCYTLESSDGTSVEDDSAMVAFLREM
ncbi:helix-turn-helix transcriptional regulator [bacterium]|nr:helix-turn-helix transcriptional regulator [bacterium]